MLNSRIFRTTSVQLTVLQSLIFAACFFALLVITYLTITAALRTQMQTEIRSHVDALLEEAKTDGREAIVQDINERVAQSANTAGYYYFSDANGQKLAGNLDNVTSNVGWRETGVEAAIAPSGAAADDEDHQIWAQGVSLPDGSYLLVGQDAYRLLSVQETIISTFAWSGGLALLFSALAGFAISRGFLQRIDAINKTSHAIMAGNLTERIPVRGTSDEIDKLSLNLNQLFDGNHQLLESLRQVTTDIAHDLRSPLSRLRQGLEEARMQKGGAQAYVKAIDGAITESEQLLSTFSALLRIAQIESGSRKSGFKHVDLSAILQKAYNIFHAVAEDADKKLVARIAPEIAFYGDAELLMQMFVNLLENAIRHTPADTTIDLSLEIKNGLRLVAIADSGPGIPAELRDKVFQRFYRLESSRTRPGNGLGLAMVAAVAGLHGIAVTLEDNQPGLRVDLTFPSN